MKRETWEIRFNRNEIYSIWDFIDEFEYKLSKVLNFSLILIVIKLILIVQITISIDLFFIYCIRIFKKKYTLISFKETNIIKFLFINIPNSTIFLIVINVFYYKNINVLVLKIIFINIFYIILFKNSRWLLNSTLICNKDYEDYKKKLNMKKFKNIKIFIKSTIIRNFKNNINIAEDLSRQINTYIYRKKKYRALELVGGFPINQKCGDLLMICEYPISIINFKKKDYFNVINFLEFKIQEWSEYNIYINNYDYFDEKINMSLEFNWEDGEILKEDNILLIEHLNKDLFLYFAHILVYEIKESENEQTSLLKAWEEWDKQVEVEKKN